MVAVDVGDVRTEQAEVIELLDHPESAGDVAHPDVHADGHTDVPGKLPVVLDHLGDAEPWTLVPMARVISPSSDEKYLSLTRRISSGDSRTLLNHQSAREVLGLP